MVKSPKKVGYRSPLEKHPKFVHAIGMITIENASLESMLAELLGATLGIHLEIGRALFFTPKAAIARVDLIENVASASLANHPDVLTKVRAITKRSKAVMGKRHKLIHSIWGVDEFETEEVFSISPLGLDGGEISLETLNDIVRDFRLLVEEAGPLIDEVQLARGLQWQPPQDRVPLPKKHPRRE